MKTITTTDGRVLTVTSETITPFVVAVPHQLPAYLEFQPLEPDEEAGDSLFSGDHDLHGHDLIETIEDAARVIEQRNADQHQAIKRAVLVEEELIRQGVLAEAEDADEEE